MAVFHVATNTPPKPELIARWVTEQAWAPNADGPIELLGSFHLDDPAGEVGMQVFVAENAGVLLQVPLTYRDAPLPNAEQALVGTLEHSVLGTRYVYDGLRDDQFLGVVAGVAACGYGQALGFATHDDRWYAWPDELIVRGTGTVGGRVAVDGFALVSSDTEELVLRNDQLELTIFRKLTDRAHPAIGLTATLPQRPSPITLAAITQLS